MKTTSRWKFVGLNGNECWKTGRMVAGSSPYTTYIIYFLILTQPKSKLISMYVYRRVLYCTRCLYDVIDYVHWNNIDALILFTILKNICPVFIYNLQIFRIYTLYYIIHIVWVRYLYEIWAIEWKNGVAVPHLVICLWHACNIVKFDFVIPISWSMGWFLGTMIYDNN